MSLAEGSRSEVPSIGVGRGDGGSGYSPLLRWVLQVFGAVDPEFRF